MANPTLDLIDKYLSVIIGFGSTVSIILVIAEFFWLVILRSLTRRCIQDMIVSYSSFIPNLAAKVCLSTAWIQVYFIIHERIVSFVPQINWYTTIVAFLIIDFLYYWKHRIEHQVRLFWGYHSVHHSSSYYNYAVAFRGLFTEQFTSNLFYLPAVFIGFHPVVLVLCIKLVYLYQFWLHSEMIGCLHTFDLIFNSPSNHRVHHGCNDIYIDKNLGGVTMLWDHLFGTYQSEVEASNYGLTKPIKSANPFNVYFYEFSCIFYNIKNARSLQKRLSYLLGHPGREC
jgi:sterol desaturase/sphingolipid hydroxylase (fatty acid hydroxylase superfamily)